MSRSPFFYVGDKYKLAPQFQGIFPKKIHKLIEPFCGGGSVFLNIKADLYVANDNNEWVIKLHRFFNKHKNNKKNFMAKLESMIYQYGFSASALGVTVDQSIKQKFPKTYYAVFNKQSYKKLKEDFNKDKTDLFKLYLLLIFGFNHMLRFNKTGDFNLPVGNVDYNGNVKKAISSYFSFSQNNNILFSCSDFETFIKKIHFGENDLIYIDPPYLISKSEYNKNWTEDEEERLLRIIDKINLAGGRFALSNVFEHKGRKNELLINWSKKYNVFDIKSNYISFHDNTVKNSREVLITNFKELL